MKGKLVIAGWKTPSLVDIRGKTSFTLWLCGCNLRCPFCHNWEIAEGKRCSITPLHEILEALEASSRLVDALHVTGGEPLLQYQALEPLLEKSTTLGLYRSINTNCTLPHILGKLAARNLVDHVATDLKIPTSLTGLPDTAQKTYIQKLLECAKVAAAHRLTVELRIPVPRGYPNYLQLLKEALAAIARILANTEWYIVVNPLVGPPVVNPRSREWCSRHCNPQLREIEAVINAAREVAEKTYLNTTLTRLTAVSLQPRG